MKYSTLLSAVMTGKWFILPQFANSQRSIVEKLLSRDYSDPKFNTILSEDKPMMVTLAGSIAKVSAQSQNQSSPYDNCPEDTIVVFNISGTMLKYGTWCSYGAVEIAQAMCEAACHPNISGCILDIDCGGGSVDAIPPYLEAIKCFQDNGKPIVACVDLCASAAYYVACNCNEIIAGNNLSAQIGSIGVMMSFMDYSKYYAENGIEQHTVYSNLSDWKNLPYMNAINALPDEATKYDLLKSEELDPLAKQFQDTVLKCRPKVDQSIDGVISGRMFFAEKAKECGLIDNVGDMAMAVDRCKALIQKNMIHNYTIN